MLVKEILINEKIFIIKNNKMKIINLKVEIALKNVEF